MENQSKPLIEVIEFRVTRVQGAESATPTDNLRVLKDGEDVPFEDILPLVTFLRDNLNDLEMMVNEHIVETKPDEGM
jgi:hypothetical protein